MGVLSIRAMGIGPDESTMPSPFVVFKNNHESHPSIDHLILLVFEAVLEVVCVSLPGYIIARLGHFDADKQKFLANLNVMLFTPCLIFTKLASQLNADKLVELAVIPVLFIIQTLVSYLAAAIVSRGFGFNKRASNFVTAMAVFGNSNSLPISLVLSLAQTLKGLHWDKIPGDNDDEVAARGILYLLIFQQLGQLVRWSWGYHVLLAPKDKYEEYCDEVVEEGGRRHHHHHHHHDEDHDEEEAEGLIQGIDSTHEMGEEGVVVVKHHRHHNRTPTGSDVSEPCDYEPAGPTPVAGSSRASVNESGGDVSDADTIGKSPTGKSPTGKSSIRGGHLQEDNNYEETHLDLVDGQTDVIMSFPRIRNSDEPEIPPGIEGVYARIRLFFRRLRARTSELALRTSRRAYFALPAPAQQALVGLGCAWQHVSNFIWEFMNPPLWAMLIAVLVASIPWLQRLFFEEGSFVKNSVTAAVQSSGGVAVPLILVVLGANLARNTQAHHSSSSGEGSESHEDPEEKRIGTRLLIASLISRMLLPTLAMGPVLALFAKYVPVSILDDPIFIVVCFLLVGAPSALQLAQICQINNVYENVMSKILFQSYVIWILPSTLVLVMCALEVVEWANAK